MEHTEAASDISAVSASVARREARFRGLARRVSGANKLLIVGVLIVGCIVLTAIFAPFIAPYSPYEMESGNMLQPPSRAHLGGTDEFGRDIFSRTVYGARTSIQVSLIAVSIALAVGPLLGLLSAHYGRWVDSVISRFFDILFGFPAILLALLVLAVLGPGKTSAMVAIGIVFIPILGRVVRSAALVAESEQYVEAARSLGMSDVRMIVREVLPNVLPVIIVQTTLALAYAILNEAALAFLGVGTQPPEPSWGRMLFIGKGFLQLAPWMGIIPGAAIFVAVLGFNTLGDGLRDILDPRLKT